MSPLCVLLGSLDEYAGGLSLLPLMEERILVSACLRLHAPCGVGDHVKSTNAAGPISGLVTRSMGRAKSLREN